MSQNPDTTAQCPNCNRTVAVIDGAYAEHRTQTRYPLICGLSGDPVRIHDCRWSESWREEDGFAAPLDCDTCDRTFIGHGPTLQQALDDANALHEEVF